VLFPSVDSQLIEVKMNIKEQYKLLKKRHYIRECKRQINIKQGLIKDKTRKSCLHTDLTKALNLIKELLKESK